MSERKLRLVELVANLTHHSLTILGSPSSQKVGIPTIEKSYSKRQHGTLPPRWTREYGRVRCLRSTSWYGKLLFVQRVLEQANSVFLPDIMAFSLPDCLVTKRAYNHDDWPGAIAELKRRHGFSLPMSNGLAIYDVVIWTDTGRLLCCDVDAFSTFALRTYGVQLDLSDAELLMHIKANVQELRAKERQQSAAQ